MLGAAACGRGGGVALDPASVAFFDTARLVMTGEEQAIFRHLPDPESRQEFIRDFWAKRDPDPDTPVNEFKAEFEARVEYANKRFREGRHGFDTDRGRIYIYLGPPEKTDFFAGDGAQVPLLWWVYYRYDLGIAFTDNRNLGAYTISEITGNLFDAIQDAKLGAVVQSGAKFLNFDLRYDRGARRLFVTIPVKKLSFKEEDGRLRAEFEFTFYIYEKDGALKRMFKEVRTFSGVPADIQKSKEIAFEFSQDLLPGKVYVDVVLTAKEMGKARKIFTVKG